MAMKKILRLMIVVLLLALNLHGVRAEEEEHVIIEDYSDYMTAAQYKQLNDDLAHIKEDYDISIYFIYDTSITDTDEGVAEYANGFLKDHGSCANNVAIVMSSSYYYVAANGTAAGEVLKNDDAIFNRFYSRASALSQSDPNAFFEGITDAYQYVVKIVNEKVYQSDAPVSAAKAFVNDFSDLLSDEEEEKLNRKLQKIKEKHGFDAVVVTTDSFNNMEAGDYADDFYDYSQYSEDGIVFILNMAEGTWYVSTKGKAIDYFTDYGIDEIFDEMVGSISNGEYYKAFVIYADRVEEYITNGEEGDIIDIDNHKEKKSFGPLNLFISTIAGAISSLITGLSLSGQMKNTSRQHFAGNYIVSNSFHINGASDMLVNRHVSRTRRVRDDRPSGGSRPSSGFSGGGSSVHTSSSGSSHGGHGGHF